MTWVRLDDGFADHPKVMSLGRDRLACIGVHVAALCYCARHLTDGLVPASFAAQFPDRLVDRLVWAGLWEEADGPYGVKDFLIHDYLTYNPSRESIETERAQARLRMNNARRSRDVRPNIVRTSDNPVPVPVPDVLTEHHDARDDDNRKDLEAFVLVRHRIPTPAQRRFLDTYLDVFDVTGPERAERVILANPHDPIGALKADLDAFRAERLAKAEKAESKPRPARDPRDSYPSATKELLAVWAASHEPEPAA